MREASTTGSMRGNPGTFRGKRRVTARGLTNRDADGQIKLAIKSRNTGDTQANTLASTRSDEPGSARASTAVAGGPTVGTFNEASAEERSGEELHSLSSKHSKPRTPAISASASQSSGSDDDTSQTSSGSDGYSS